MGVMRHRKQLTPLLFAIALFLGVTARGICAVLCSANWCPGCLPEAHNPSQRTTEPSKKTCCPSASSAPASSGYASGTEFEVPPCCKLAPPSADAAPAKHADVMSSAVDVVAAPSDVPSLVAIRWTALRLPTILGPPVDIALPDLGSCAPRAPPSWS